MSFRRRYSAPVLYGVSRTVLQRHRHRSVQNAHHRLGLSSRVPHQLPSQRHDRHHSAHGIYPQEQPIVVCAQMVIVYDVEFIFNTHATAARNASVIISSTVITKKRIPRSPRLFLARMPEMLRPRYRESGQRQNHAGTSPCTVAKSEYLRRQGYNVMEVWECEVNRELKQNEEMKHYFDHFQMVDPLNPRHALYGGRTNAAKLYHCCQGDEQIRYVDFTSLYPHVNRSKTVPTGHPKIITENFDQNVSNYFGLIKCTVVPPRALFHPVLPYRTQGKLMFALCKTCADTCNQTPCTHSDAERAIRGTWCTIELEKALEKGYRLLQIHEV